MYQFEETGGGTYGLVGATWPFAKLKVTKDKLELNISLICNLQFRPVDVTSIVASSNMPFSRGIRINHTVKGYKSTVVFKSLNDTTELLRQIDATGFLTNKEPLPIYDDIAITTMQATGGFAMKTSAAIVIAIIWNALILTNFYNTSKNGNPHAGFGLGAQLAFGFMMALSVGLMVSDPVRNMVLKEGRTFKDISAFVYFSLFITTIMLIASFGIPA